MQVATTHPVPTFAGDDPLGAPATRLIGGEKVDVEMRIATGAALEIRVLANPPADARVAPETTTVRLQVPPGTRMIVGRALQRHTRGSVTLELADLGRVEVAQVEDGHRVVALDRRRAKFDLTDRTRILATGNTESLVARVNGRGNLVFGGTAEHADLTVIGTGYINVGRVRQTLRRSCIGSGDIRVSRPPAHPFALA